MMLEIEMLEDDDEAVSLASEAIKYDSHVKRSDTHRSTIKRKLLLICFSALTFLLITLVIKPFGFFSSEMLTISDQTNATANKKGALHDKYYPQFACPSEVHRAQNVDSESFEEVYSNVSRHIIQQNVSSFLKNFRDEGFDGWGKKYDEVKGALCDWKAKHFAENLKDGDSIFESACGIGLNLLLTLEVVHEVKQLSNVKVYGNEYIAESVDLANEVLGSMLPKLNDAKETICQADSTDLSFIPSSAFDLVFTGYIRYQLENKQWFEFVGSMKARPRSNTPLSCCPAALALDAFSTLLDPLNFNAGGMDKNYELYEKICSTQKNDWSESTTCFQCPCLRALLMPSL